MCTQAAYNNISEIELEDSEFRTVEEAASSLYTIGTKVAKQFHDAAGELVWYEGVVQRYDEEDDLWWVLYNDGDSEDMNESEVRDAVHDYRLHVQQQEEAVAEVESTAVGSDLMSPGVDTDEATVLITADEAVPAVDVLVANTNSVQSSGMLDASEIAVAMRAMTAAAEQLTSAAVRIELAVQQQQSQQQQQQQQLPLPPPQQQQEQQLPPWHLHNSWHHLVLQQQQQQQVYYQQQQMLTWQQWQRWQR
jgi:Lamin-B receptor of TUDOR domain